jgi:hypothetical protein
VSSPFGLKMVKTRHHSITSSARASSEGGSVRPSIRLLTTQRRARRAPLWARGGGHDWKKKRMTPRHLLTGWAALYGWPAAKPQTVDHLTSIRGKRR